MKDLLTFLFLALLVGAEAVWAVYNPLHIPAGYLPARTFGFQVFQELGSSMQPAVPVGSHVLISSWAYWRNDPRPGDVVAFAYPRSPSLADLKRIVAVGGSSVEVRHGVLYVDGKPQTERGPDVSMPLRRLPNDTFFVLGDNFENSEDSRSYGPIPRQSIIGKRW